jgi:hypothetical protein
VKESAVASFPSSNEVEAVLVALDEAGFAAHTVSVLLPRQAGAALVPGGSPPADDPRLGSVGDVTLPELGSFVAAGPLMKAIAAAGGSLVSALQAMGLSELEARVQELRVRAGDALVAVLADGPDDRRLALQIFTASDAKTVGARAELPAIARP